MRASQLVTHALTHAHGFGVSQRLSRPLTPLPRPVISVGNLAFGGRAKTPIVAALVDSARTAGWRPGVLTRGYGRRGSRPVVVVGRGDGGPPWQRTLEVGGCADVASRWAPTIGDEPAWLAATLPGVPIGVGHDRRALGRSLVEGSTVDLLFLDDGFQHPLPRAVDVVIAHAADGTAGRISREPRSALARADLVVDVGPGAALERRPGSVRDLRSGAVIEARSPVHLLVGVADPASVGTTAAAAGLSVRSITPLGDHRAPGPWRRRRARPRAGEPWLITEKDALGWAAESPPPGPTWVLGLEIAGADALWERVRDRLGAFDA